MHKPSWITKSGPYKVTSYANGNLLVQPSWGQYGAVWNAENGGGPGFPGRMRLAECLERWLNSAYTEAQITEAMERISQHDSNLKSTPAAHPSTP